MNEAILRHIGVALLGHLSLHPHDVDLAMIPTYRAYRETEGKFENLIAQVGLRSYLIEQELAIPPTITGVATLAALGLIFGEIQLAEAKRYLGQGASDKLFNKLRTRLRVRRD